MLSGDAPDAFERRPSAAPRSLYRADPRGQVPPRRAAGKGGVARWYSGAPDRSRSRGGGQLPSGAVDGGRRRPRPLRPRDADRGRDPAQLRRPDLRRRHRRRRPALLRHGEAFSEGETLKPIASSAAGCSPPRRPWPSWWALPRAPGRPQTSGFLHRDVKPSNVFLRGGPDGGTDPKLIDFRIAKRVVASGDERRRVTTLPGLGRPAATAPGIIFGTPHYLSPEQAPGEPLSPRSDVYSLAVMLYEILAGSPLFLADELGALLEDDIVAHARRAACVRAPEQAVPAGLDREILRAPLQGSARRAFCERGGTSPPALWTALSSAACRVGAARRTRVAPALRAHPGHRRRRRGGHPVAGDLLSSRSPGTRHAGGSPGDRDRDAAPAAGGAERGRARGALQRAPARRSHGGEGRGGAAASPGREASSPPAPASAAAPAPSAASFRIDDLKTPY